MTSTNKIILKSSDGEIFTVRETVAMQLGTVKSFFDEMDPLSEKSHVAIPLQIVNSKTLTLILSFTENNVEDTKEESDRKQFEEEFLKDLTNEDLLEMLLAANYLDSRALLEVLFQAAADRIKNRSVAYARRFFGVENDFTPEEEETIRQENSWAFEGIEPDDDV